MVGVVCKVCWSFAAGPPACTGVLGGVLWMGPAGGLEGRIIGGCGCWLEVVVLLVAPASPAFSSSFFPFLRLRLRFLFFPVTSSTLSDVKVRGMRESCCLKRQNSQKNNGIGLSDFLGPTLVPCGGFWFLGCGVVSFVLIPFFGALEGGFKGAKNGQKTDQKKKTVTTLANNTSKKI